MGEWLLDFEKNSKMLVDIINHSFSPLTVSGIPSSFYDMPLICGMFHYGGSIYFLPKTNSFFGMMFLSGYSEGVIYKVYRLHYEYSLGLASKLGLSYEKVFFKGLNNLFEDHMVDKVGDKLLEWIIFNRHLFLEKS